MTTEFLNYSQINKFCSSLQFNRHYRVGYCCINTFLLVWWGTVRLLLLLVSEFVNCASTVRTYRATSTSNHCHSETMTNMKKLFSFLVLLRSNLPSVFTRALNHPVHTVSNFAKHCRPEYLVLRIWISEDIIVIQSCYVRLQVFTAV